MRRSRKIFDIALSTLLLLGVSARPVTAGPVGPGQFLVANESGGFISQLAPSGTNLGVFASGLGSPGWLATDGTGNVYVSEFAGNRVDKFSRSGALLLSIPTGFIPGGVEVARDGTIYVGEYFSGNVHRYSASGASLGLFVSTGLTRTDFLKFDASGTLYISDFNTGVRRISPSGVDLGNFVTGFAAEGIAFDESGNVYISNDPLNIVEKYSPSGVDLGLFAQVGPAMGTNTGAYGLAFDRHGNLYVANFGGGNIREFSPSGADLGIFASIGPVGPRDVIIESVPAAQPSALLLLGSGLAGLTAVAWRHHQRK